MFFFARMSSIHITSLAISVSQSLTNLYFQLNNLLTPSQSDLDLASLPRLKIANTF